VKVNDENYLKFINSNQTLPKVLFFSDKARVPLSYKALSNTFNGKMEFAFIPHDSEAASNFSVSKFPSMLVYKDEKSIDHYKGDLKYKAMFEFLNVFS